jgi:amino acid adenylation domain-containing protein
MGVGDQAYLAVINDDGQFAIWLANRGLPPGWREAGPRGTREACQAFIEQANQPARPGRARSTIAPIESTSSVLELPLDHARRSWQQSRGAREQRQLSPEVVAITRVLAETAGTSVHTVVLAAFSALVSRYSGKLAFAVGLAKGDSEHVRALRVDVDAQRPFADLLARMCDASASDAGPIQVAFRTGIGEIDGRFELLLACDGVGGIALDYQPELFEAATARRVLSHVEQLLTSVAAHPDAAVSTLAILGEDERAQLRAWNETARPLPERCVHEQIAEHARRDPSAPAAVFEGRTLSYGELVRKANALAHELRRLGAGPDTCVGICVERSLEMVVGIVGILQAGAAYVPLDPGHPAERVATIASSSRLGIVVAEDRYFDQVRADAPEVALLALGGYLDGPGREDAPTSEVASHHLAYVMYTSGSTGVPKGVMIPHVAVASFCAWLVRTYELSPVDRVLQQRSPSFDVAVWEMIGTLVAGACAVIARLQDPAYLIDLIANERVTHATMMPSMLNIMLGDERFCACKSVRSIALGAEPLLPALQERFFARKGGHLANNYGPTETTVASTYWRCDPAYSSAVVPIGRPIDNTAIYVLDDQLGLAPIGVAGELYIAGTGLARGYADDPAQTAERFLPDPFSGVPGARMYRTGDLGRWRADGSLEFLGRRDDQVKIRGFRVELGEVTGALIAHPAVREAEVIAREDEPGDRRLVAYVVARSRELEPRVLRRYLRERLPDYMVPSAFVVLDAMPLTANGKLDRKALPAPTFDRARDGSAYVPPTTATEHALAQLWSELLKIDPIGIHDDFVELGGHSLLAIRITSRMRDRYDVELPLRAVFEHRTISGLAAAIDRMRKPSRKRSSSKIPPLRRGGELPLSFAQQRMWFLDQLERESPIYNQSAVVRLRGPLDGGALEGAIASVVARHESLRTTFSAQGGRPIQTIASEGNVPVTHVDLRDAADPAGAARQFAVEHTRRPFDLERGPLLRVALIAIGDGDHWLVITAHHIVADGWSIGVLWRELAAHYVRAELPPLPIQYADFAAWQRDRLTGQVLDDQLGYWKQQLAGIPTVLELPTDRPRPPVASYRGGLETFELPRAVTAGLKALARERSATLFMTLLAAFQTLLHRYSGHTDIVVGSPIASRNRAELEDLIGFFANTLVLRTDLSGAPTFDQLLERVRQVTLDAYAHEDVPFERLVEELRPQRSVSHSPLFQVLFVLQNPPEDSPIPGVTQEPIDLDTGTAKFDLTLSMEERDGALHGSLEYSRDLYDAPTVARMLVHFGELLASIVADPARPISKLALLTAAERQELLVEWNATDSDFARDRGLHELVEDQVDRTPHAIALVAGNRTYTYRELDHAANQIANHLREVGVGPGSRVTLFLERRPELVFALLGALKAGAAYVPLDPAYPVDRLARIVTDTQAQLMITERSLAGRLPAGHGRVLELDGRASGKLARAAISRPPRVPTDGALSHVIYTSGSTGQPKGVAIEHRVMVNWCVYARALHAPGELATALLATSVCFDMSLHELFVPLASGGRVVLVQDLFALAKLPPDVGVTYINAVPSVLAAYLRAHPLPASVVAVSCAGEPLPNALVAKLHAAGITRVFDHYGPTETFVATSTLRTGAGTPTIGRPIANMQAYVLDRNLALVPRGHRGELYVGGAGLARGYLNRPELTDERFVPNPFGPGRLYRTGDLVRWLPGGTLEYVGRADHQVKIRGFRVEPGEIEVVLATHAAVREAAIVAVEDAGHDKRLVAYVVSRAGALASGELRAHLEQRLPAYMVPSAFVELEALPLTPTGKIDRLALARMAIPAAHAAARATPLSPAERTIAQIFGELLGASGVGAHDDFFALGGHSLLSVQLVALVRERLGVELAVSTLFRAPTVEALARALDDRHAHGLVELRPGEGVPVVCVHPGGGHVLCYRELVQRLAHTGPCYGIEAPGLANGATPLARVEQLANKYADAVRDALGTAPVHLVGWSFGGLVAYELARTLRARGHAVVSTTMIDAWTRAAGAQAEREGDAAAAVEHAMTEQRGLARAGASAEDRARLFRVFEAHVEAYRHYQPAPQPGRFVLVCAEDRRDAKGLDPLDGWREQRTSEWDVRLAPGTHFSIVEPPNVDHLARLVDEELARV